jgi:ribosomal-protein-alanine N-acetyltransferase
MMMISVRRYQEQDYPRVMALNSMRIPGGYHSAVFIRQASVLFPATFLVAERAGEVIGFTIGACEGENSGDAWVLRLGVEEKSRRQQVGRQLLTSLLEIFVSMQVHQVSLSVSPENSPAIRLYQKFGFEKKEYHDAYFGEGEPRIIMQLSCDRVRGSASASSGKWTHRKRLPLRPRSRQDFPR